MIFARFLAMLLFAGLAFAGETPTSSGSDSAGLRNFDSTEIFTVGADFFPRLQPSIYDLRSGTGPQLPKPRLKTRTRRNLADLNGDVCYTMRSYKIKPTERIREGESVDRGYSECEMASSYEIRSAEAHEQGTAKLK